MEAVLTGEEVIDLGSVHLNAADMGAMTGPGRMEIAKAELENRAGDLSRIADKGKGKGEGQVEEEETGSSPDLGAGQVAVGMGDEDMFVDFGTKVERTSTRSRSGSKSRSPSRPSDNLKAKDQGILPHEVQDRAQEGFSSVSTATPAHAIASASSSHAGLDPARDSRHSTPIIDKAFPRLPAQTGGISGKPTKVDKRSPASSSFSTTKNVGETETGGGLAEKKKEKKKRTTDIDDLFGGLVTGGKEAGAKKRKVDDRTALGAETVASVKATGMEELEAVAVPAEGSNGSKSKLKRVTDTGKVKLKKKKKKGDDLDDIFGF
jgi:hypothetical protein